MFSRNRFVILFVVLVSLLVVAAPALAQDVPPDVTPINLVNELGALLVLLVFYSTFGSAALTYLKPIFLNQLQERLEPNIYLVVIYTVRLIGGALTLFFFGGVQTLYDVAPSLQALPLPAQTIDAVVFVGATMLLSLGQEGIYVILNVLRSLAGLPPVGTPTPAK